VIGRELVSGLRSAWNIVQQWARDEHSLQSFRAERAKLTGQQLARDEAALRDKHHVHPTAIDPAALWTVKSVGVPGDSPSVPCTRCASAAEPSAGRPAVSR
jgi:hypothetical protein